MNRAMSHALRRLLHTLPIPSGRRWRSPRLKAAPFAAFSGPSGFQMHTVDQYERSARRWRVAKWVFIWVTAFLAAWITLESMRALTMA
jgi:hypothetical protein